MCQRLRSRRDIFAPSADDLQRDPAELFDLKTRPGYYNPAAKSALFGAPRKPRTTNFSSIFHARMFASS